MLIVDDHAAFRCLARELFEAEGFDVVGEAADAASALRCAAELCPDVVLLDVQLPDRDGIAIARELEQSGPAVVLTSSRSADDLGPRLRHAGGRGFIAKDDLSGAAVQALLDA